MRQIRLRLTQGNQKIGFGVGEGAIGGGGDRPGRLTLDEPLAGSREYPSFWLLTAEAIARQGEVRDLLRMSRAMLDGERFP